MLNRPGPACGSSELSGLRPWQVDERPGARLVCVFVAMLLPLTAIGIRLAHVQARLADRFIAPFEQLTESYEPIPSRDGRILGSDGRVLAEDEERFSISVHYRWLEEPPDPDWLRQQALSRLSRGERREPERVQAEVAEVLARRRALWDRLAVLTGRSAEEIRLARTQAQQRVERILALVETRRREQQQRRASNATTPASDRWWEMLGEVLTRELTTSPTRLADDPVVIREQLDYHAIVTDVSSDEAAAVEIHPEQFPGTRVEVTTSRIYPSRDLAAHVIGSRTTITDEELEERRARYPQGDPLDYRAGDRIGRTGLERTCERQLRGTRGLRKLVSNRRGEIVQTIILRQPKPGEDVGVTLDLPLQERTEALLDQALAGHAGTGDETANEEAPAAAAPPQGGCIIAIDIHTGEVLAAAAAPRFDLNLLNAPDPAEWQRVMDDSRRPFFPRLTQMALPPGSVFKTLTAVAILETGIWSAGQRVECHGYLDRPDRHRCYIYRRFGSGHGPVDLGDAICHSCNVYFYTAGRELGPEPLVFWSRRFGFGQPTGIDLPGEVGGHLPDPAGAPRTPWYPGDTLGLAIGQSKLTVTPLQIARMMAAVANGGYLVRPHLVRSSGPRQVGEVDSLPTDGSSEPVSIPGLSASTLAEVRHGLERVVADRDGTGYKTVRLAEVSIAGKTGTAEVGGGRPDHAWFAGYAPADNPQVAFAVVLENAGSGGKMAGPVARELVRALVERGLILPRRLTSRE